MGEGGGPDLAGELTNIDGELACSNRGLTDIDGRLPDIGERPRAANIDGD